MFSVVGNCDDHDLNNVEDIDYVVPEGAQAELPNTIGEPLAGMWMLEDEVDRAPKIDLESFAEALPLLIE